jgi:hypothetical protein
MRWPRRRTRIAGSAVGWEMTVRIGQSLEITDALWDLVPVMVAAGQRVDARPAAQPADLSPAARGLDDASRALIRSLGDAFTGVLAEAVAAQRTTRPAWCTAGPRKRHRAFTSRASSVRSPETTP